MLKLLFKLWADQKRRDFKWGRFLGEAYFFALFLSVVITITVVVWQEMDTVEGIERSVPLLAAAIVVPDFLGKLLWKHDETVMDHYLKSRPIGERCWNRFLLAINLLDFWNWTMPLSLLPFCVLFLPLQTVAPAWLAIVAVSMVGGVAITALRRAKGWSGKWPVLLLMVYWALTAFFYAMVGLLLPWWAYIGGFLLLCGGAVAVFYHYLCSLRRYDEQQAKAGRLWLKGTASLFAMEYVSVLRSKRLRIAVLVVPLVFVINCYTQQSAGLNVMFYMMLVFAVFMPSMMLGQWVFSIEGNYFDGLWTKPVSIETLLRNKYLFYALLNIPPTLLVLPLVWTAGLSPWVLSATWLFTAGLCNLLMLPTCLISSRIELFQSAFFNYQGASLSVNVYGLIVLVPVIGYCVALWLLPTATAAAILAALGLAGVAIHRKVIGWLARKYELRRHECFERYRQ